MNKETYVRTIDDVKICRGRYTHTHTQRERERERSLVLVLLFVWIGMDGVIIHSFC